jgi:hypothetical protein
MSEMGSGLCSLLSMARAFAVDRLLMHLKSAKSVVYSSVTAVGIGSFLISTTDYVDYTDFLLG